MQRGGRAGRPAGRAGGRAGTRGARGSTIAGPGRQRARSRSWAPSVRRSSMVGVPTAEARCTRRGIVATRGCTARRISSADGEERQPPRGVGHRRCPRRARCGSRRASARSPGPPTRASGISGASRVPAPESSGQRFVPQMRAGGERDEGAARSAASASEGVHRRAVLGRPGRSSRLAALGRAVGEGEQALGLVGLAAAARRRRV